MSLKYQVQYNYDYKYIDHQRHGVDHRVGRPSSLWQEGNLYWYEYGEKHRLDGPVMILQNSFDAFLIKKTRYCIRGVYYTKEEYESKIRSLL